MTTTSATEFRNAIKVWRHIWKVSVAARRGNPIPPASAAELPSSGSRPSHLRRARRDRDIPVALIAKRPTVPWRFSETRYSAKSSRRRHYYSPCVAQRVIPSPKFAERARTMQIGVRFWWISLPAFCPTSCVIIVKFVKNGVRSAPQESHASVQK